MLSEERRSILRKMIQTHYHEFSAVHIAKLCGVGHMTVRREADRLGIRVERQVANKIINPQMDRYIKQHWKTKSIASIAARFGVSENAIADRAASFGLPKKQAMIAASKGDKILFVLFNRHQMTIGEMSRVLGQHPSEIKRLSSSLNGHPEIDVSDYALGEWRKRILKRLSLVAKHKDIARMLDISEGEVLQLAQSLGVDVRRAASKSMLSVVFKHAGMCY